MVQRDGEAGGAPGRRGALIVPVLEASAAVRPWHERYVPGSQLGVPPHVTLLYPFSRLDQLDADALLDLDTLFAATPPVRASLVGVGQFPDVVYLQPEPRSWFVGLTEALSRRFDVQPYGGIHAEIVPHLTVARHTDPAILAAVAGALGEHLPIAVDVREVLLLEEGPDGYWRRSRAFPLGTRATGLGGG